MKRYQMNRPVQITIGILTVILASYLAVILFFGMALYPFNHTRAQAIEIAKKQAKLTKIEAYGVATTDETSYAVTGRNNSGQEIGVIIPQKSKNLTLVKLDRGISPKELVEKSTTSVVLGLYKGKPAWEVNTHTGFKVCDFKTGKVLYND